jgi:probable HAF family extracellular repeat protein
MAVSFLRCIATCALLSAVSIPCRAAVQYSLTILGQISANSGGPNQVELNNTGTMAYASNGQVFLYHNMMLTQVSALNGLNVAQIGISDAGHLALLSSQQGYFYAGGGLPVNLGSLAPNQSTVPNAVNNSDVVVGYSDVPSATAYRAFEWSNGAMTPLAGVGPSGTTPNGTESRAYDINNSGQIAGSYGAQSPGGQAVIWTNNVPQLLPIAAGYARSEGYAINAAGQVAGYSADSTISNARATIWTGGVAAALPTPTNFNYDLGYDINDSGVVVGTGTTILNGSPFDALIWSNGQVTDLNTLIAPSTLHLDRATAIDDAGDIVGYGHIGSQEFAYLLTVPEPSSLTLLTVGSGALVLRRRKQAK